MNRYVKYNIQNQLVPNPITGDNNYHSNFSINSFYVCYKTINAIPDAKNVRPYTIAYLRVI